jgi:hypothetical protein
MVRVPAVAYEVVQLARPLVELTEAVPQPVIVVPSEVNFIVPAVGAGLTVARNVMPPPRPLGLASEVSAVVVAVPLTAWASTDEVLVA